MFAWVRKVYDWMGSKVHSPYAQIWLFFLFFVEASVFIIPVDPLLILFCVKNEKRSLYYALLATLASVIGGVFGYLIGSVLWDSVGTTLVQWLISEKTFNHIVEQYRLHQSWAVLIASFTPVPYKAVTISAGFCKLPIAPFIGYSIIGRGARFLLIAGAIMLWGNKIRNIIDKFFNYLVVAFVLIVVLSCSLLKGADMLQLPMPKIKEIEALAQLQPDCISFSQGALKIGGVDEHVKEYARQILTTDRADYYQAPLGLLELRQKLAEQLSLEAGARVGIEQVMISHGGVGALLSLCLTLLGEHDEVLLPEPAYPVYQSIVRCCKATPVFVSSSAMVKHQGKLSWHFDITQIEKAITKATRMIIIANPSNPTGMFLSKQDLTALKRLCESRGIYLVLDEVYDDYIYEGVFTSGTAWATKSPYVVRIGSLSKSFGMSGWRIGFLVGDAQLIKAMAPVQAASISCPTVIAQYAALYALEHKQDIIPHYIETVRKSREIICNFLDLLQERGTISYVRPAAGFYAFFKLENEHDSLSFVMDILQGVGVAMTPGSDFGETFKSYVRFCFARDPEMVMQGVTRLKNYFAAKNAANHVQPQVMQVV